MGGDVDSARKPLDAYDTPPALAAAMCQTLAGLIATPGRILEPSAGSGVFLRAAGNQWRSAAIAGVDVEPRSTGVARGDFLADEFGHYALVIGNPPWSLAEEFVETALSCTRHRGHVAFILRSSFHHGQARTDRLHSRRCLRWWIPLRERPSYTADGRTDSVDSSIFVWERGFVGNAEILPHLSWRDPVGT